MTSWTSGYVAEIGYTHGFYRELTPAVLGLVGLVRGQRSPIRSPSLTYCELGCGQGFTANVLAAANPHIDFYATDFNPAHIVGARALAGEAGLPNIHFFDDSFAEFLDRPDLPAFDIISLHGIYSWVSAENRRTIVEIVRRKLKPGGLVYISYNALPGWAAAMPLRQLFVDHAATATGPIGPRIEAALQYVEKLRSADPAFFRAVPGLAARFDGIKNQNRNYLAHEYFNKDWTPFYHSDVVSDLAEAKVSFVGSAALLEQFDFINLNAAQQQVLADTSDPLLKETVRDYMVNRQFRRDVFVKGAVGLSPVEAQNVWLDQRFVLSTTRADVPLAVKVAIGEARLQSNVYEPILDHLAGGPRTLRQLLADQQIAKLGRDRIHQALAILVGADHLQPALDEAGDHSRSESTKAFNAAVMNRAEFSADLNFLASPVTGGGVGVNRIEQLFLRARDQGRADPIQFVWSVLSGQNQRLIKDGRGLESPEENLAELRSRYDVFMTKRVPVLKHLGIC